MKTGVFISYSHADAQYVSPIVKLLQAMRQDLVFQDSVHIKPGKQWEFQLLRALNEAEMIVVFWCEHSAQSAYVKKEYQMAIDKSKDVLPLLLDDSPLEDELAQYQWIDLRKVIYHEDQSAAGDSADNRAKSREEGALTDNRTMELEDSCHNNKIFNKPVDIAIEILGTLYQKFPRSL